MNYYEHHIGDYAKDAGYLSMIEDGAYRRLIDAYYSREKRLPPSVHECCKLARATTKPERDAVIYVLREFFELRGDGYFQKRCDEEIARFQDKSAKAKASIAKRWERVRNTNGCNTNVETNDIRTYNEGNTPRARPQSPVTKNQEPKEQDQKPCPAVAGRFDDFWLAFPRHENKKKARDTWRRKHLDAKADSIIADVRTRMTEHRPWREGFIPHPTTYLNGERWDDAIDRTTPKVGAATHNGSQHNPNDPASYADGAVL